ncbi:MAG: DsbA family protein [Leptospirillia bacterium]
MKSRLFTSFAPLIIMLLAIAGLSLPATSFSETPPAPTAPPAIAAPDAPPTPPYVEIKGRDSSHEAGKVKITVFLDFFCSHCHHFDTTIVPVLLKEHGDALEVTYVGYPIVDPQASHIPILAYYLAEDQGRGEEMKDILFSAIWDLRMDVTRPDVLLGIAQKAGLDLERFKAGFNNNTAGKRVEEGIQAAQAIGVRGTPTLLIDNHLKVTDNSIRTLEAIIAEVLGENG